MLSTFKSHTGRATDQMSKQLDGLAQLALKDRTPGAAESETLCSSDSNSATTHRGTGQDRAAARRIVGEV